jgi:hypothetical protein
MESSAHRCQHTRQQETPATPRGTQSTQEQKNGISKTTVEYDNITWTITATAAEGGISFAISPDPGNDNAGDIRGLFLDLSDDAPGGVGPITTDGLQKDTTSEDGWFWYKDYEISGENITQVQWGEDLVFDLGEGANMRGEEPTNTPPDGYPGPNIFDLGIEFGDPGAGENDIDFINSTSFFVKGITLSDLANQFFGLRLTSTAPDRKGSLKLVGQFTDVESGNTLYQGFTRGSWLFGARSDDITGLFAGEPFESEVPTYEKLFLDDDIKELTFISAGRNGGFFENPSLKEALGLNGGGLNQFAAQSTAAYLNALYLEKDGDDRTTYPLSKETVLDLTTAVLNEGKLGGTVDLTPLLLVGG